PVQPDLRHPSTRRGAGLLGQAHRGDQPALPRELRPRFAEDQALRRRLAWNTAYAEAEPKRAEADAMQGATLLEFGSPWCGHCRRAHPLIAEALAAHPDVRHIKVADASGKRLGRSFGVKLWPTLVFLRD